jgi:D-alanyl-D-alanine carboxypeptidase
LDDAVFFLSAVTLGVSLTARKYFYTFHEMVQPERILDSLISSDKTPSAHYIHFTEENVIYEYCKGLANIKAGKSITDQSVFHPCSVTKTFTALAILNLQQQGILNIEQPVKTYWPKFPYMGDITIHHLLSHTAGIPNPIPLRWIHLVNEHSSFDRNAFFQSIFEKHKTVKTGPNEKFLYSNLGYVLLGQLIEKMSGKKYEEFITGNIISKIGIQPGELGFTITDFANNVTGYQKNRTLMNMLLGFFLDKSKFMENVEGKWKPFKPFYINGSSYGGLIGTANSFRKYVQLLLRTNSSLINAEYKKLLFTENQTNDKRSTGMCLSWFCGQLNGVKYFAHPGGGGGFYCELRMYPEINRGSVIMFNRTGISNEKFLDKVDKFSL